jgi:hypothetical protein
MSQIAVQAFRAALLHSISLPDPEIATALKAAFATMYGVRRPVAAIRTGLSEDPVVVCDDGTLWREDFGSWRELPSIPGTVATGGGIASPLHTKLSQIRTVLDTSLGRPHLVDEIKKILDAP